jgi:VCBS repeat-containing protein
VTAPGVLGNDTDQDGNTLTAVLNAGPTDGTLTLNSDGSFTYSPATASTGQDSFNYHANDGFADSSNTANVCVNVKQNVGPFPTPDPAHTPTPTPTPVPCSA